MSALLSTPRPLLVIGALALLAPAGSRAASPPLVVTDEADALQQSAQQVVESLASIDPSQASRLRAAVDQTLAAESDSRGRAIALQRALDPYCLLTVSINPESRVKVEAGPASLALQTGDWRGRLVKVHNVAGVKSPLRVEAKLTPRSGGPESETPWLRIAIHRADATPEGLTGAVVEYRVLKLKTDVGGDRAAVVSMDVGQGTADIGFRNDVLLTFRCLPGE